jgi:hypothetical protein
MKLVLRGCAILLLLWGVPISLLAVSSLRDPKPEIRDGALPALVIFGLPPMALAAGLLWWAQKGASGQQRDRLQETFFRLIQAGHGDITVLQFAMETGLNGEAAAAYLDERAREFNAVFRTTDDGALIYVFALNPSLSEAEGAEAMVLEQSPLAELDPESAED